MRQLKIIHSMLTTIMRVTQDNITNLPFEPLISLLCCKHSQVLRFRLSFPKFERQTLFVRSDSLETEKCCSFIGSQYQQHFGRRVKTGPFSVGKSNPYGNMCK